MDFECFMKKRKVQTIWNIPKHTKRDRNSLFAVIYNEIKLEYIHLF